MPPSSAFLLVIVACLQVSHATDPESSSDAVKSPTNDFIGDQSDKESRQPAIDAFRIDNLGLRYCSHKDFSGYAASDQDTLRQVLLVHRHGDRTPVVFRQGDSLADEPFWKFHGYGQLTNRGKERMYILGKIIRHRYEKFTKGSVHKNLRISRSSGAPRCIESAQVFLASFLSLDSPDSPDAEALSWISGCDKLGHLWQPASVHTMATSIDGMLAEAAECKALRDEIDNTIEQAPEAQWIHQEFKNEVAPLKELMGFKMERFMEWSWASDQMDVERSYFESKLDPRILAVFDRVQEAGRAALLAQHSTIKSRRLRSGLLINDMIENMKKTRQQDQNGPEPKKLLHYSTHDVNLFSLVALLGNAERFPFTPSYAASLIMELHQDDADEWFVKFFYMPHVPSKIFEIHVDTCEMDHPKKRCTLEKLEEVLQPYIINKWSSWMEECKNDISKLNPY